MKMTINENISIYLRILSFYRMDGLRYMFVEGNKLV